MAFINTRDLLKSLCDALIALTWTPDGAATPEPLFDSVAFFDTGHAAEALQTLYSYGKEMAVIVPEGISYSNRHNVGHLDSEKRLVVTILFTGRPVQYSGAGKVEDFLGLKRQGAAWVIDEERLGTLGMVDAVVNTIAGRAFAGAGPMEPTEGDAMEIAEKGKSTVRKGYYLTFECKAGEDEFLIV